VTQTAPAPADAQLGRWFATQTAPSPTAIDKRTVGAVLITACRSALALSSPCWASHGDSPGKSESLQAMDEDPR